jgi:hypothetical protein
MTEDKNIFNFDLEFPEMDYFKTPSGHEKAEDIIINGYILKMPKLIKELKDVNFNDDRPLISQEDLLKKHPG